MESGKKVTKSEEIWNRIVSASGCERKRGSGSKEVIDPVQTTRRNQDKEGGDKDYVDLGAAKSVVLQSCDSSTLRNSGQKKRKLQDVVLVETAGKDTKVVTDLTGCEYDTDNDIQIVEPSKQVYSTVATSSSSSKDSGVVINQSHQSQEHFVPDRFNLPFFLTHIPMGKIPDVYRSSVKRSMNSYAIKLGDIFSGKFEEVFTTNYLYDLNFLLNEVPRLQQVPWTIVHGTRGVLELPSCLRNERVVCHRPPLENRYSVNHSKMAIIFHADGVRVAIMTNNFISEDWGVKSQGCWVQDFPLKCNSRNNKESVKNDFENVLCDYLLKQAYIGDKVIYKKLQRLVLKMREHDFSNARGILIPSVPGRHNGAHLHSYGHLRLRKVLRKFDLHQFKNAPIVAQYSSMGSLKEDFLTGELLASFASSSALNQGTPRLELIWPTREQVRTSFAGYASGSSICCPSKNIKEFFKTKGLHYKWSGVEELFRDRAMPHIKTYTRYDSKTQELAWVLITSANLSGAAWGKYQKKCTQLYIMHYELGVLVLPEHMKLPTFSLTPDHRLLGKKGPVLSPQFGTWETPLNQTFVRVPLPYKLPPQPYSEEDKPWVWDEEYTEPDYTGYGWPGK